MAEQAFGEGVRAMPAESPRLFFLTPPISERAFRSALSGEEMTARGVACLGDGPQLEQAPRVLKPNFIVGAGGLRTRHDAMLAGEAGADYVMFGESGEARSDVVERVAWWTEIFTVPCVAYANDLESIGSLVRAGADFIALGGAVFSDPRGAGAALREAAARVTLLQEGAQ